MENNELIGEETTNVNLPFNDELFLSPVQKFSIYNKFPWKLLFHFLLVIATTTQILIINTSFSRAQERLLYQKFISEDDKTQLSYHRFKYLYTIKDIQQHLQDSIIKFYSLSDESFDPIPSSSSINLNNPDIHLKASYMKSVEEISPNRKYIYILNKSTLGPFDNEKDAKAFVKNITSFQVNFTIETYTPLYFADYIDCQLWNIEQMYTFDKRAHFIVRLEIKRSTCDTHGQDENLLEIILAEYIWLHCIVLILSSCSLFLMLRYFYLRYKLYWNWKYLDKQNESTIETRLFKAKMALHTKGSLKFNSFFHSYWSGIALIGHVIQISGCFLCIFDWGNIIELTELFVALGCTFSYLILGKYMGNLKKYSMIFMTLQHALPKSMRFILSILPIFLGYALFGYCVFWRSEYFDSLSNTIATLFALIMGDSVYFIMDDLSKVSFAFGQLYCYSFCLMFYVVVMNTFISIIGEAYAMNKLTNYSHWIYSFFNLNNNNTRKESLNEASKKSSKCLIDLSNKSTMSQMSLNDIKTYVNNEFNNLFQSFYDLENITRKIIKKKKDDDYFNYINDHLKDTFQKIDKRLLFKKK